MAKVSFAKNPEVAPQSVDITDPVVESTTTDGGVVVETRSDSAAMIPAATLPVARPESPAYSDEDIGFDDIILPRINITQKVGQMSNVFTPGEIVLKMTLPIYTAPVIKDGVIVKPGTDPLTIIVLGFRKKQFVEKVSGGSQGALCNTEEEVARLGGTLDYQEHKAKVKAKIPSKLFQRLATALVLVECPKQLIGSEAMTLEFPYECEGKHYALALWSMKGTAYTNAAKKMFTARKIGHLKGAVGYPGYTWSLGTKLETYSGDDGGETFAHIPVLKEGRKNTEVFAEFVKEVLGMGR